MREIEINTEYIRLDHLLKLAGLVNMGGEAKHLIQMGCVELNGEVCTMRTKKIRPGEQVTFDGETIVVREE